MATYAEGESIHAYISVIYIYILIINLQKRPLISFYGMVPDFTHDFGCFGATLASHTHTHTGPSFAPAERDQLKMGKELAAMALRDTDWWWAKRSKRVKTLDEQS